MQPPPPRKFSLSPPVPRPNPDLLFPLHWKLGVREVLFFTASPSMGVEKFLQPILNNPPPPVLREGSTIDGANEYSLEVPTALLWSFFKKDTHLK